MAVPFDKYAARVAHIIGTKQVALECASMPPLFLATVAC